LAWYRSSGDLSREDEVVNGEEKKGSRVEMIRKSAVQNRNGLELLCHDLKELRVVLQRKRMEQRRRGDEQLRGGKAQKRKGCEQR
jgi:hypothetical protein